MAPPSATDTPEELNTANHDPSPANRPAIAVPLEFPKPPTFEDPYKEREYQKVRLALAFRIFAKLGFDEGVAGHITLRASIPISVLCYLDFLSQF
jgi:hypothetical protein